MRRILFTAVMLGTSFALHAQTVCPGKTWERPTPQHSGWNADRLAEVTQILSGMNTTSLVVAHKGRIVFEYGRPAFPVLIHSMRKSIMSMLWGIAQARDKLNLETTLRELEIDDSPPLTDVEKTANIRQLLMARSCVYHEAAAETDEMKAQRPPRGSCKPGENWYYNNWDFNALGTIYKKLTGKTVYEGLQEDLAKPLQFENFNRFLDTKLQYEKLSEHPAYHMNLSANDLARIGLLMGHDGDWCGTRLVPEAWARESTAPISRTNNPGVAYGYLWWVGEKGIHFGTRFPGRVFSARGHLGQFLLVDQKDDLIVVHLVDSRSVSKQVTSIEFGKVLKLILSAMPVAEVGSKQPE